ncbi:MAG: hypothetical protein FWG88_00280 [Oscillospiraceae bacterium]|nr:hypothetical protein [Oscillospiraceae bacterium]
MSSIEETQQPNNKESEEISIGLVISVMVFILAVIPIAMIASGFHAVQIGKDPTVIVADDEIVIEVIYGQTTKYSDIDNIKLIELSMREIGFTRNTITSYTTGQTRRGNYTLNELTEVMLFVQLNVSPTIKIERRVGKDIYISFIDGNITREIYEDLYSKFHAYNGEINDLSYGFLHDNFYSNLIAANVTNSRLIDVGNQERFS